MGWEEDVFAFVWRFFIRRFPFERERSFVQTQCVPSDEGLPDRSNPRGRRRTLRLSRICVLKRTESILFFQDHPHSEDFNLRTGRDTIILIVSTSQGATPILGPYIPPKCPFSLLVESNLGVRSHQGRTPKAGLQLGKSRKNQSKMMEKFPIGRE